MGVVYASLQDVDWMRKGHFLWINLWMSLPNFLHRAEGPGLPPKPYIWTESHPRSHLFG